MLIIFKITIVVYVTVAFAGGGVLRRKRQIFNQPFGFMFNPIGGSRQNYNQVSPVSFGQSVPSGGQNYRPSTYNRQTDFNQNHYNQYSTSSIKFPTGGAQNQPNYGFFSNNPSSNLLKPGFFNEISNRQNPRMIERVDADVDPVDSYELDGGISDRFLFSVPTRCLSGYIYYNKRCHRLIRD